MELEKSILELIPRDLINDHAGKIVIQAGWATDYSFVFQEIQNYNKPVALHEACNWLEVHREILRVCHLLLLDRSVIRLYQHSFNRYDKDDSEICCSGCKLSVFGKQYLIETSIDERASDETKNSQLKGIMRKIFTFEDFDKWADNLHVAITIFKDEFSVYPNILSAIMSVYDEIDRRLVDDELNHVVDDVGNHPEAGEQISLSGFCIGHCYIEFTINEITPYPSYLLIYDEDPDFDGDPILSEQMSFSFRWYNVA